MQAHTLKCWPEPFQAILDGHKQFEYRLDDRGFAVGDILILQEWDPHKRYYAGPPYRQLKVRVTYILRGQFGVPPTHVVMSISPLGIAEEA